MTSSLLLASALLLVALSCAAHAQQQGRSSRLKRQAFLGHSWQWGGRTDCTMAFLLHCDSRQQLMVCNALPSGFECCRCVADIRRHKPSSSPYVIRPLKTRPKKQPAGVLPTTTAQPAAPHHVTDARILLLI